jgi:predicted nucleotidyltransferase
MNCRELLDTIAANREELRDLGIGSLSVFGSVARGEATEASDIDLLVEFSRPVGLFHFAHVRRRLSELLGAEVDLVTVNALRKEMRERVMKEAIRAA